MLHENLKLSARRFHARKSLGQNFLINQEILSKIVSALEIKSDDPVVEIGPGLGFLTKVLIDAGAKVTAVELDRSCVNQLNAQLKDKPANLKVIHADFLKCDLKTVFQEKSKVVGNIPYNITSPIIAKLFGEIDDPTPWLNQIDLIVLTVQAEIALRMVARACQEHYSQMSLFIDYYAEPELLFSIEPKEFFPIPQVTSAVVRLKPRRSAPVQVSSRRLLRQLISAAFRQRRKMLRNTLGFLNLSQRDIDAALVKLNFDPQARAESLNLKQFAMLTDMFFQFKEKRHSIQ